MNNTEYQGLAMCTKNAQETTEESRIHCGMGSVTEVGELIDAYKRSVFYKKPLDLVNLTEEVGDVFWYIALGVNALGIDPAMLEEIEQEAMNITITDERRVFFEDRDRVLSNMIIAAAMVYGSAYREVELHQEDLTQLFFEVQRFCRFAGISPSEARDRNIAKLRARYPGGFTTYDALNRDLDHEREILEATD